MHPDEFTIVIETEKGAREAVVDVWKAAMAAGWIVVGDYDLTGLLAGEEDDGVEIKSLDICHPELARPFVKVEMRTALCMPCNVLIFSKSGVTKLMTMRPGVVMPNLFENAAQTLGDLPERIDRELREILQAAA
jgi:uncharacterized protein (DUF302 family)